MAIQAFQTPIGGYIQSTPIHVVKLSPDNTSEIYILIERLESTRRCSKSIVQEAKLTVNYLLLRPSVMFGDAGLTRGGSFSAHYWRDLSGESSGVCLTGIRSHDALFLDPAEIRGLGLGTYIMDMIVDWAHQWPNAFLKTIRLDSGQADESNIKRRNRFYEQFNICFEYDDQFGRSGSSRRMCAGELLRPIQGWRGKVFPMAVLDYLRLMLRRQEDLTIRNLELAQSNRSMLRSQGVIDAHPVRFALKRVSWRIQDQLLRIGLIGLIGLIIYLAW